jgi:drug/metabolite transporter (DMT)-like permease
MTRPREANVGPWLVALGAALWGTESAWRIPLLKVFAPDVIVFWEHTLMVAIALPFVIPRLRELRHVSRGAIAWLVFSGVAGSAVGAILFTQALAHGNATVVNVVLNLQPVLSTTAAFLIFGDKLTRGFYPWAALAVLAGGVLAIKDLSAPLDIDAGTAYALGCALFWGLSTVAGRGVMNEMSLPLAAGLRVIIGLVCMTAVIAYRGLLHADALWPASVDGEAIARMVALATLSGAIPLVIYFKGLQLTRASTAGYFEMMQTLAAGLITWGVFHDALASHQVAAGVVLLAAVTMVQRAQAPAVDVATR